MPLSIGTSAVNLATVLTTAPNPGETGASSIIITTGQQVTSPAGGDLAISTTTDTVDNFGGSITLTAADAFDAGGGGDDDGGSITIAAGNGVNQGGAGLVDITSPAAYIGGSVNLTAATGGPGGDSSVALSGDEIYLTPIVGNNQSLFLGGAITDIIGAYGGGGVTQPTVTGSRGGNAALASLLTALANIGWIVDSSTA